MVKTLDISNVSYLLHLNYKYQISAKFTKDVTIRNLKLDAITNLLCQNEFKGKGRNNNLFSNSLF